jgi:hypothetical protein
MRFDVFATRALYIVVFAVASVSSVQGDLWWLLRAGQDIWRTHHVSLVDHYSFTAYGDYWPNHEWLWEVVAYLLHRVGGMPLLTAFVAVTITATVMVLRRISPAEGYIAPIVVGAALPMMSMSWTIRPQVTSTLFFAITILCLARGREIWLPPLFLLWANVHAQVALGGVVLAAVWVGSVVDVVRAKDPEARPRLVRLTAVGTLSLLATLATPLGFRLWTYVLDANGRPGQHQIAEWYSAFHFYISDILFWMILVLVIVLSIRRRERLASWESRVPLYATLAMAPLAVEAVRTIPFFVAAALPLCMTLLEFETTQEIGLVGRARAALAVGSVLALAAAGAIWAAAPPRLAWKPMWAPFAQALRACPGPLYNDFNTGATLIWWVPEVKVFVDNRQDPYSAEVIDAGFDHQAVTYREVFTRWKIRCSIAYAGTPLSVALKAEHWRRTYSDGITEVWVSDSEPLATTATE